MKGVNKSLPAFLLVITVIFSLIPAGTIFVSAATDNIFLGQLNGIADNGSTTYKNIYNGDIIDIGIGEKEFYRVFTSASVATSDFDITVSDSSIAKFDKDTMMLYGVSRGKCTLTVSSTTSTASSTYTISVNQYIEGVNFFSNGKPVDRLVLQTEQYYKASSLYSYSYYPRDNDDEFRLGALGSYNELNVSSSFITTGEVVGNFYILCKTKNNIFALPVTITGDASRAKKESVVFDKSTIYTNRDVTIGIDTGTNDVPEYYEYIVERGTTETYLQTKSKDSKCTWRPYYPGTYMVTANAWTNSGVRYTASVLVTVKDSAELFKYNSLSLSESNIKLGEDVQIKSQVSEANGIPSYKYEYSLDNGKTWHLIRDFTKSYNTFWKPTKEGTYLIRGTAKDILQTTATKTVTLIVGNNAVSSIPVISSFTASKTSVSLGESITLSTTATGSNLKYKYLAKIDGTWTTIRSASTTSSYTWKPTKTGTYTVRAVVTNGTQEVRKEITVKVTPVAPTISSFKASKTSAALGESITLSTTATGSNLKYKYLAKIDGTWTTIRSASTTSTYTWKPTKTGTYTVRAVVTNGTQEVRKEITVKVTPVAPTISSFKASKTSAALGESITLSTTATGSNLKYKYLAKIDGTWTTIRSASTTSSYTWKPTKAGTYTVRVVVTNGTQEVRKEITVKVTPVAPTISSFKASKTSAALGESITLSTTATGSNLKYKYLAKIDGTWTTIRSASTTSTYTWKPTKTGTYTVRVVVKNGTNETRKDITVKIN